MGPPRVRGGGGEGSCVSANRTGAAAAAAVAAWSRLHRRGGCRIETMEARPWLIVDLVVKSTRGGLSQRACAASATAWDAQ